MGSTFFVGLGVLIANFVAALWLARKERREGDSDWKWAALLALTALVSGVLTTIDSLALDSKLDTALTANKEIATRLTSRADFFTPEVRARFVERLKALPPKSVGIARLDPSGESIELTQVLQTLLQEADRLSGEGTVRDSPLIRSHPGRVVVQQIRDENKRYAEILVAALAEAGIPDVTLDSSRQSLSFGSASQIVVKPK